jgi:hypothetical protein
MIPTRSACDIRVGDFVCILLGCDVPIILRAVCGNYELVGEVFVHGIMCEEVMDALAEGKYKLQDFILQ